MVDREATEPRSEDPRPEEPRSLEQSDGEQSTGADQHIVSLWASGIPGLGVIAEHNWFVINDCGVQTRWEVWQTANVICNDICLLYTSPSPRDRQKSRMPSSA